MNQKRQETLNANRLYLCAPVNALVEGIYEQKIPFTKIKQHGDFGLGTFDNLDGEMVMLDGQIYQINAEGQVRQVDDGALTPFACVTFFNPMSHDEVSAELSYADFQDWLPGLHLHFLSADRQQGGHLLECQPTKVRLGLQMISSLELALPMSLDYLTWDFCRDTKADLSKAEK